MAFNKSKALENALKYLNQGKVNQAIAEYQQILRNDPKDQATLMTVGDLFARQGDMSYALEYFERLAQVYLFDGFNSKAIAIYKKIAKLAPNEINPLEKLADLYVQQGVLSEARPLFLQIAEAHLKANRGPKAVEVLHRLLDVEPENPRVQMRLAELYNVMGQKGDAAKTYLAYGQRLFERGDTTEAEKVVERALEVAAADPSALVLKARILASNGKDAAALKILQKHPDADAGTEVTNLLVDLELKTGQIEEAADRARNQLVRGNSHFGLLFRVSEALVEKGQAAEALPLFRELRDPMIEVGEHDKFVKSLSAATEKLPGNTEALELLASFCRHTSDPFPLTVALTKLADIYEAAGNDARSEELIEELADRNRDDERMAARLEAVRIRNGKPPQREGITEAPQQTEAVSAPTHLEQGHEQRYERGHEQGHQQGGGQGKEQATPPAGAPAADEVLDPETRHYLAQALTDVDLFSSYGLTQKATNLLKSVLQRAPRHTPTLERLLDLSIGAGNDQRAVELASTLEQIHRERNELAEAERFAAIGNRFHARTDSPENRSQSHTQAPSSVSANSVVDASQVDAVDAASVEAALGGIASDPVTSETPQEISTHAESQEWTQQNDGAIGSAEEVDLSDEWEAMVQEVVEPPPPAIVEASTLPPAFEIAHTIEAGSATQAPTPVPLFLESEGYELRAEDAEEAAEEAASEGTVFDLTDPFSSETSTAAGSVPNSDAFELELTPELVLVEEKDPPTTEDFISELASEVEGMEPSAAFNVEAPPNTWAATPLPAAHETTDQVAITKSAEEKAESLNQLSEVFQAFRSELGELDEEDEDLEIHYNLGIAYREMGLLDEAIGELQKVAKAVQKGKPFRYAMNCAVLLALSFGDKGESKIAALWYKRALDVPGLDLEAVLALRYDLGLSLEMAGESDEALDCFRQVYAMNIDYRDVSDRIATLQHH